MSEKDIRCLNALSDITCFKFFRKIKVAIFLSRFRVRVCIGYNLNYMKQPLISVIAPFNGSNNLKYFLQSLQQQTLNPAFFEVIIVEDGDKGGKKIADLFNTKFNLQIIPYQRENEFKGHSAGICRNLGTNFAAGEYFVFIDTDCILHHECLEKHWQILQKDAHFAVCGYACELPAIHWGLIQEGFFESYEKLEEETRVDARLDYFKENPVDWDLWYTCNASVHREMFFKAGRFDESGFRCHDMDLAYRLFKAGCKFYFEKEARIIHVEHPRQIHNRAEQQYGWKLLATKHPELETYIFDKVLESQRYQYEIAEYCETCFLRITDGLNGVRDGYSWIVSLDAPLDALIENLRDTPYIVEKKNEYIKMQLGLHRNCWDYEIFVPHIPDTSKPVISVLIPFFNAGEKIAKTIVSIFSQSLQNFEVILIDDGSYDNTTSYLLPFFNDPRVRVFTCPENRGLANALNLALTHSRTPIVVHIDADDWLEPDALEEIHKVFNENTDIAAVYGDVYFHVDNQVFAEKGHQINSYEEYFTYKLSQAPRAYKKEKLLTVGGWNISDAYAGRFYEDRLMLATLSKDYKVKWIDKRLYHCRYNPESLSRIDPLLTASAKLSILYDEANKNGFKLNYTFEEGFLKGELKPAEPLKNVFTWSVIIPFYKGVDFLSFSVKSWLESDFMQNEGEIIIVDDACKENLQAVANLAPDRIKIIRNADSQGPAQARNKGAALAKYEMIFFSDADHIVPNDILGKHSNRHLNAQNSAAVVGSVFGRRTFTVVSPEILERHKEKLLSILQFAETFDEIASSLIVEKPIRFADENLTGDIWRYAQKFSFTDYWLANWGEIILKFGDNLDKFEHKWTRLSTGNVSMKREDFVKSGGFDEYLRSMEDWELGIRIQKMGMNIICAPEAEPFHQIHPVDENRNINNESAVTYLLSKHPEFIQNLLNDKSRFVPPAQFFFTPTARRQYTSKPHKSSYTPEIESQKFSDSYCLITLDDGPHPIGTQMILDVLNKHEAKAMFFLLGYQVEKYGDIVKTIADNGHELGIHSWTHTDCSYLTTNEVIRMLDDTVNLILKTTGKDPKYARPPYGKLSPSYLGACRELDLIPVGWDTSSEDWGANSEKEIIIKLATEGVKQKVLLFHDGTGNPENTAKALEWLLNVCETGKIKPVLPDEFKNYQELPEPDIYNPFV
jgi:glycosyltransferase involved in cell wall biosynthesis/peptidoglycan/xylan/chitin deacetylase (PgdA/CDA1 family)